MRALRRTVKVHDAPRLSGMQVKQLLHLLWRQHLVLRRGGGGAQHGAEPRLARGGCVTTLLCPHSSGRFSSPA